MSAPNFEKLENKLCFYDANSAHIFGKTTKRSHMSVNQTGLA
ncbi:hypothetical protein AGMMS49941_12660 [Deferribacterales bacterium]|nr:hypothetical protein AGMMS49941_12660 [Deferribacterales bacterium]